MFKIKLNLKKLTNFRVMSTTEKRKSLFKLLLIAILCITFLIGIYWYFVSSSYISTDNAYVAAEIAQVTSSVDGTVKAINVVDTQIVKAGDVLIVIDDIDAKLASARALGELVKAKAEAQRAEINLKRREKLIASKAIAVEELTNAENSYRVAKAAVTIAQVAVDKANIDFSRTIIKAPIDGVIAKREVQLGQKIHAGQNLMAVVPSASVYVNANFKEVQLRKVSTGQTVKLWSDIYGAKIVYHGRVSGLSGGTGSVFSLIPAQNATGNWIKVVQRLPVRIALDSKELMKHPLQVGLSMNVAIDISGCKK